jgi:hypothetical protein
MAIAPSMRKRTEGKAVDIKPIKTTRDYRRALKKSEGLMHAQRNTPAGDRLDVLIVLVEAWEAKQYALDLPDPIEAIKCRPSEPHKPAKRGSFSRCRVKQRYARELRQLALQALDRFAAHSVSPRIGCALGRPVLHRERHHHLAWRPRKDSHARGS